MAMSSSSGAARAARAEVVARRAVFPEEAAHNRAVHQSVRQRPLVPLRLGEFGRPAQIGHGITQTRHPVWDASRTEGGLIPCEGREQPHFGIGRVEPRADGRVPRGRGEAGRRHLEQGATRVRRPHRRSTRRSRPPRPALPPPSGSPAPCGPTRRTRRPTPAVRRGVRLRTRAPRRPAPSVQTRRPGSPSPSRRRAGAGTLRAEAGRPRPPRRERGGCRLVAFGTASAGGR